MIKPRNTLVVARVIEKAEQKIGGISVPANNDLYAEAEVIAVGPGTQLAAGAQAETFDLKPGQRVLVKHKQRMGPQLGAPTTVTGIQYVHNGKVLYIFEQGSIVGILAEPGDAPASEPVSSGPKLALA